MNIQWQSSNTLTIITYRVIIMYEIEYYTKRSGQQPVAEWIESLDKNFRNVIRDKIEMLANYGLRLINTEMLKNLSGKDKDFYELRGSQCRIGTFYDRDHNRFVLLHGWLKKKQKQVQDIEKARSLLHEYLFTQEG